MKNLSNRVRALQTSVLLVVLLCVSTDVAHADSHTQYTVEAILQASFARPELVRGRTSSCNGREFEVFLHTQAHLLRSSFVLAHVAARSDVSRLGLMRDARPDEVEWLRNHLDVDVSPNCELIVLRMRESADPEELKKVLEAVIEAFQSEALSAEKIREAELLDKFRELVRDLKKELGEKISKYLTLENELGEDARRSGELRMLRNEVDELMDLTNELHREFALRKANEQGVDRVRVIQGPMVIEHR